MRVLGVDFGFRRIGLATAETDVKLATPRPQIVASGALKRDAGVIGTIAASEDVSLVVVGLPLESDGNEGRMARICRQLAGYLSELGLEVRLIDESMTSVEAERSLQGQGLKASRRKKLRDSEAACLILERYMDEEAPH
jgi:putative Holliday junction resolvase